MTLGEQIVKRRNELELTQQEVAYKAKISLDTLCRLEKDKANPTLYVIQNIQQVLNFKLDL